MDIALIVTILVLGAVNFAVLMLFVVWNLRKFRRAYAEYAFVPVDVSSCEPSIREILSGFDRTAQQAGFEPLMVTALRSVGTELRHTSVSAERDCYLEQVAIVNGGKLHPVTPERAGTHPPTTRPVLPHRLGGKVKRTGAYCSSFLPAAEADSEHTVITANLFLALGENCSGECLPDGTPVDEIIDRHRERLSWYGERTAEQADDPGACWERSRRLTEKMMAHFSRMYSPPE